MCLFIPPDVGVALQWDDFAQWCHLNTSSFAVFSQMVYKEKQGFMEGWQGKSKVQEQGWESNWERRSIYLPGRQPTSAERESLDDTGGTGM